MLACPSASVVGYYIYMTLSVLGFHRLCAPGAINNAIAAVIVTDSHVPGRMPACPFSLCYKGGVMHQFRPLVHFTRRGENLYAQLMFVIHKIQHRTMPVTIGH